MSSKNMIEVQWEFDIVTNEELQRRLGLTEGEVYDIIDEDDGAERLNMMCAQEMEVPVYVNLDLLFDDPRSVDEDEITETLSDEYGWLVDSWEWSND